MTTQFTPRPRRCPACALGGATACACARWICRQQHGVRRPAGRSAVLLGLALPRDPEGLAYLRYEPVARPLVVLRDEQL